MKKFLFPGLLAVLSFFLLRNTQAVPLDVPTGSIIIGTGLNTITLSSSTLPNNLYGWCISHVVVTAPSAGTFTMSIASSTLVNGTTNYNVSLAAAVPYSEQWAYRTPYCAPNANYLFLKSSVAGSTITYEGYSFKGWNP